jgi:hypothetical protein
VADLIQLPNNIQAGTYSLALGVVGHPPQRPLTGRRPFPDSRGFAGCEGICDCCR